MNIFYCLLSLKILYWWSCVIIKRIREELKRRTLMLMEDLELDVWKCVCACALGTCVSVCDCNFKFWHPSLVLGVVKCTVNKRKRGSPHLSPPRHPRVSFSFWSPDVHFIHSAGSLSDITVFMWEEGSAWALRHLCYLGLLTYPFCSVALLGKTKVKPVLRPLPWV